MEDKTRTYAEKEILLLSMAIENKDNKAQDAFNWLMANDCVELGAMCDFIVFGNGAAKEWLEKNGYILLADFLNALHGDDNAIKDIMKSAHKEWAATVSIINDDDNSALMWLVESGLKHFAMLAKVLKDKINDGDTGTGYGGGVSSGGSGGIGGGPGFAGFGGGSFGGAGAGGMW